VKLRRRPFVNGPGFIYSSNAAIPPLVSPDMLRHDVNQIVALSGDDPSLSSEYELFNEKRKRNLKAQVLREVGALGARKHIFSTSGNRC